MSATNEHIHYCTRCGVAFACWCTPPDELADQRMCPKCGEQYRRLHDARSFRSYKSLQRPNRFRR